ncbi:hypothetical protein ACFL4H_00215 [Candidatus Neomarinimicrobiota bacterium]
MTRGTFILVLPNEVRCSTEFNGDMYPEGHGEDAFRFLSHERVKDSKSFSSMIKDFNKTHHNYDLKGSDGCYQMPLMNESDQDPGFYDSIVKKADNKTVYLVDMTDNKYFDNFRFFSDWLFIKNLSGHTITFWQHKEGPRSTFKLKDGETTCCTFGDFVRGMKEMDKVMDKTNVEPTWKLVVEGIEVDDGILMYISDELLKGNTNGKLRK